MAAGAGKGKALEYVLSQLRDKGMYPAQGVQVRCTMCCVYARAGRGVEVRF